jgi:hypothetical protein
MRICDVEGCGRVHEARGMCHVHYTRWMRRHELGRVGPNLQERLAEPGMVEAMVTVRGPSTETFPAVVRTRLIYEGRPAFLANDPVEAS